MNRLTRRLTEEKIPYAIIGGMAMVLHGFQRVTGDVDILTTRAGLDTIHQRLIGRGYVPAFQGARKKIRDTQTGIKVDLIAAGEYAGQHQTSIVFPDPAAVSVDREGMKVVDLPKLIELKIASGMSSEHRRHIDFGDVAKMIAELRLPRELADQLDPYVRDEYIRMWEAWKNRPTTAPDYEPGEE